MKLGLLLLVVAAVALMGPNLSEGRTVDKCELKKQLEEALVLPRWLQRYKERILAIVVCEANRRSRLDTGLVKVFGKRVSTTAKPPTKPTKPVQPPKPTKPVQPPKPTKPVLPPKPTKPVQPPKPTKPVPPPKPTKPVQPPKPTKPIQPTKPIKLPMTTTKTNGTVIDRQRREVDPNTEKAEVFVSDNMEEVEEGKDQDMGEKMAYADSEKKEAPKEDEEDIEEEEAPKEDEEDNEEEEAPKEDEEDIEEEEAPKEDEEDNEEEEAPKEDEEDIEEEEAPIGDEEDTEEEEAPKEDEEDIEEEEAPKEDEEDTEEDFGEEESQTEEEEAPKEDEEDTEEEDEAPKDYDSEEDFVEEEGQTMDDDESDIGDGGERKKRALRGRKLKKNLKKKTNWSIGFYGLFQLSDGYFCNSGYRWSRNKCNTSCSAFTDDNIQDDIKCLVKSRYWWMMVKRPSPRCRGYRSYYYLKSCK